MQKISGEAILFIVAFLASLGWFFSKFVIEELPPVTFISLRFLFAALVLWPFALPSILKLNRYQVLRCACIGLVFSINLIFWVNGLKYSTNIGEGAFIFSLSMLFSPLISWLIFKNKPTRMFFYCLPLAAVGLYLLVLGGHSIHMSLGNLLMFCSAFTAGTYFVLTDRFVKHVAPLPLTTLQMTVTGVFCGIYAITFEHWPINISTSTWWWLFASVMVATNIRFLLQAIGQKHCPISHAAVILVFEPVWTLLLSIWILGETLGFVKALGCGLILASLLLYRMQNQIKNYIRRSH